VNPQNAHWFILVIINIPVYLALGRLIFEGWGGFLEALRLLASADWWLTLEKEWREDRWGTAKLPVFLVLCLALPVIEHLMFGRSNVVKPAAQVIGLL
jgi:uncharacterized membrane protein